MSSCFCMRGAHTSDVEVDENTMTHFCMFVGNLGLTGDGCDVDSLGLSFRSSAPAKGKNADMASSRLEPEPLPK